jgi:hypothetical protein
MAILVRLDTMTLAEPAGVAMQKCDNIPKTCNAISIYFLCLLEMGLIIYQIT